VAELIELSPLRPYHEALGARFFTVAGRELPRGYGDPAGEYAAARDGVVLVDRWERTQLRLHGRDPVKMVQGLITNDLAGAEVGQGVYAALLTPKGKMIADLRAFRREAGDVWLDLDIAARPGALEHLRKFVPPLFARIDDLATRSGVLGLYGPGSRALVAEVLGVAPRVDLPEESFLEAELGGAPVLVMRTDYAGGEGYDLFAAEESLPALWEAASGAGARPVGHSTLEVLRIEAGRPRWGAELDETVIPLEAGLRDRAISQTKGCYTGQEVIIRILHRGRVNWHLRGLLLGEVPVPAAGVELFRPGEPKPVGRVTSACVSPLHDQTIGLGYVRREVEPPEVLRLGEPAGVEARVYELPLPLGV
jgi:folate-binding protein YgfZ